SYNTAIPYAIDGFIAAVFGGLGGLSGAVTGGLALGVVEGVAQRYVSGPIAQVLALGVFLLVLLVRPSGLAGRAAAIRR
ncbi:MAG: branched-chain amino acid ABC transporter permease, partial [Acidimicrobiales bacterium]